MSIKLTVLCALEAYWLCQDTSVQSALPSSMCNIANVTIDISNTMSRIRHLQAFTETENLSLILIVLQMVTSRLLSKNSILET